MWKSRSWITSLLYPQNMAQQKYRRKNLELETVAGQGESIQRATTREIWVHVEANKNSKQGLRKQQNYFNSACPSWLLWLSYSLNLLTHQLLHWIRHSARWMKDAKEEKTRSLEETGTGRNPLGVLPTTMPWDVRGTLVLLLLTAHPSGRAVASCGAGAVHVIFAHVGSMKTGARVLRAPYPGCH